MSGEPDDVWVARQMSSDDGGQEAAVDTQEPDDSDPDAGEEKATAPGKHRYDRKVALGLGTIAVSAVVVVLMIAALFYLGGCQHSSPSGSPRSVSEPAAVAVTKPAPPSAASPGTDHPLPYTADAGKSCPAGSTPAQTMSGADPRNAFVCVRNGLDGQVISIDLGKSYVITAISLAPGWVGKDASGTSQWSLHRVVTTVQYMFNDTDRTLVTQDTKNVHGDAVIPIKHVLASRITMLIRQTSRPPADPQPTQPTASGSGIGGILGVPVPTTTAPQSGPAEPLFGQPASNSDPVDATFAISRWTPIGHEAI